MSALELYVPPAFILQLHPYHFFAAVIMGVLAIVLRNRCVLNQVACVMDESVCGLNVQQNKLGKLMEEQSDALKKSLDALEARVLATEKALEKLLYLNAEQAEEMSFACENACSAYVNNAKPALLYMEQPLTNYLQNSPATARQILTYLTENKSLIDKRFFSYGSLLTIHEVNSVLYSTMNKGCITKNNASPPVWSIK